MKILIVEDDEHIASYLHTHLAAESFVVDLADTGTTGIRLATTNEYDLLLIDLTLPDMDGSEVIAQLRARGFKTPILILTVISDAWSKVRVLNAGADDYLEKPFLLEELVARMRALLRRPHTVIPLELRIQDIILDAGTQTVHRGGERIPLTRKEYVLFEYLVRNRGMVGSRPTLIEHAWDSSADMFSLSLDTHMMNLRKKLKEPSVIETVHSRGYLVR